jgi:hypothetical protein
LAGAVEPGVLGERHEGGRGQALRGACDHPLNHAAIFLFAPPRGHHPFSNSSDVPPTGTNPASSRSWTEGYPPVLVNSKLRVIEAIA